MATWDGLPSQHTRWAACRKCHIQITVKDAATLADPVDCPDCGAPDLGWRDVSGQWWDPAHHHRNSAPETWITGLFDGNYGGALMGGDADTVFGLRSYVFDVVEAVLIQVRAVERPPLPVEPVGLAPLRLPIVRGVSIHYYAADGDKRTVQTDLYDFRLHQWGNASSEQVANGAPSIVGRFWGTAYARLTAPTEDELCYESPAITTAPSASPGTTSLPLRGATRVPGVQASIDATRPAITNSVPIVDDTASTNRAADTDGTASTNHVPNTDRDASTSRVPDTDRLVKTNHVQNVENIESANRGADDDGAASINRVPDTDATTITDRAGDAACGALPDGMPTASVPGQPETTITTGISAQTEGSSAESETRADVDSDLDAGRDGLHRKSAKVRKEVIRPKRQGQVRTTRNSFDKSLPPRTSGANKPTREQATAAPPRTASMSEQVRPHRWFHAFPQQVGPKQPFMRPLWWNILWGVAALLWLVCGWQIMLLGVGMLLLHRVTRLTLFKRCQWPRPPWTGWVHPSLLIFIALIAYGAISKQASAPLCESPSLVWVAALALMLLLAALARVRTVAIVIGVLWIAALLSSYRHHGAECGQSIVQSARATVESTTQQIKQDANGLMSYDKDADIVNAGLAKDREARRISLAEALKDPTKYFSCPPGATSTDTVPYEIYLGESALFSFNSNQLNKDAEAHLRKIADLIRQNPNASIVLTGYTDKLGAPLMNLKLSEQRAKNMADWLVAHDVIPADRIDVRGAGDRDPVVDDPILYRMNRRVEMRIDCREVQQESSDEQSAADSSSRQNEPAPERKPSEGEASSPAVTKEATP